MNEMTVKMRAVLATIEAGGFPPTDFLPNISGGRNARRVLVRNYLRKKLAVVLKAEEEESRRQKQQQESGAMLIRRVDEHAQTTPVEANKHVPVEHACANDAQAWHPSHESGAMLIRRVDEHAQTKPVPPAPQALDMVSQQRADPLGKLRASHATQTAEHACADNAQAWHQDKRGQDVLATRGRDALATGENVRKMVGETPKEMDQVKESQEVTNSPRRGKTAQNRAKTCQNRAKPTRNFAKSRKTLQNRSKFCTKEHKKEVEEGAREVGEVYDAALNMVSQKRADPLGKLRASHATQGAAPLGKLGASHATHKGHATPRASARSPGIVAAGGRVSIMPATPLPQLGGAGQGPSMNRHYLVIALAVLAAAATAGFAQDEYEYQNGVWVKAPRPARGTPEGELASIRRMVNLGADYAAVKASEDFLKKYPDDPRREEVMMLAGQANMNSELYFQAYEWYKRQWEEFPSGEFSERALQREYEIAEAFLDGKKRVVASVIYVPARDDGLEILNHIAEQAPGSQIAEMALLRIGEDRFAHKEYFEAIQAYDHYMELFPKSPRYRDAMLEAARATHKAYRPGFDLGPLVDAQTRYRSFQSQYPLTARQVETAETLTTIDTQRAADEFSTAELYMRTGHKDSAAYYFRRVKALYPQTDFADRADAALEAIGPIEKPAPPAPVRRARTMPASAAATSPATGGASQTSSQPSSEPTEIERLLPKE